MLFWLDFSETKFKGCLVFSLDMEVKKSKTEETCLSITTWSEQIQKEFTISFFFDSRSACRVMEYWISVCINLASHDSSSMIELENQIRQDLSLQSLFASKKTPTVSRPYNLEHKTHVTPELKWVMSEDNFEKNVEILEQIGQGASATVFKARHVSGGFVFAVKKVDALDKKKQEAIKKELDILSKCRHSKITTYFGCVGPDKDKKLWIMMDYCAGGSAFELIKDKKGLKEEQIQFIILNVLLALVYLHSNHIIHRDVKCILKAL